MDNIKALKEIIDNSKKLVVFTGAGISCPSGIPDFRSADGLYNNKVTEKYSPEEIISHSFFLHNPEKFYEFYKGKMLYPNAQPNKAHKYFANLENKGIDVSIVTQNIDGLHQKAGSTKVYELHGSVLRNYCMKCGKFYPVEKILESDGVPYCDDGGIIKPDVVLYEEPLNNDVVDDAINVITKADTMIVVGTSLVVYPAANYIRFFKGKNLVLINKSKTGYDFSNGLAIYDDIIKVIDLLEQM